MRILGERIRYRERRERPTVGDSVIQFNKKLILGNISTVSRR